MIPLLGVHYSQMVSQEQTRDLMFGSVILRSGQTDKRPKCFLGKKRPVKKRVLGISEFFLVFVIRPTQISRVGVFQTYQGSKCCFVFLLCLCDTYPWNFNSSCALEWTNFVSSSGVSWYGRMSYFPETGLVFPAPTSLTSCCRIHSRPWNTHVRSPLEEVTFTSLVSTLELKSFNNHLKKFSVVHSDRPKNVYLNPLTNSRVRTQEVCHAPGTPLTVYRTVS
jgi:hypothetical protein